MRKVVFAYASESQRMQPQLSDLRETLKGNIELVQPDPAKPVDDSTTEWVIQKAIEADFLVIIFSAVPDRAESAVSTDDSAKHGAEPIKLPLVPATPSKGRTPRLTPTHRERLFDNDATILTVVFRGGDRESLPADLKGFPCFDFSSSEGSDALLCRLVHDPIKPIQPLKKNVTVAVLQMATAGIATLVGNLDKTHDILLDQFGESLAQVVHYTMGAGVLILLFIGLVALLKTVVEQLPLILNIGGLEQLPGSPRVWQRTLAVVAGVLVITFGFYFLRKPPQVEENLKKHLKEWAHRLERSQRPDGGIRENLDKGVSQVWATAQALAGLLSSQTSTTITTADVKRAFTFIDWTRIVNLDLKLDMRDQLLTEWGKQGDKSKLPPTFATFTLAVGVINRIGNESELSRETTDMLYVNRDKYFVAHEPLEGWGYFEQFDKGITEVAAWVALAEIQSLRATNPRVLSTQKEPEEVQHRIHKIIELLHARQIRQLGAFSPVADSTDLSFARTYSTVMALWAMAEAASLNPGIFQDTELSDLNNWMSEAVRWLGRSVVTDKKGLTGWQVNPANPSGQPSLGLTAQTLCVLGRVPIRIDTQSENEFTKVKRGLLSTATDWAHKSLRDNDRMHDSDCYLYPTTFVIEPSTFLWYPWCVGAIRSLSTDPSLKENERLAATRLLKRLQPRAGDFGNVVNSEYNYVAAEALIGFGWPMEVRNDPIQ